MKRIINTNIRFDLKREDDWQAYEYLRRMDRKQFKSYTRAVVAALNDFFSQREKLQADPYLETREKEDRFLRQVLDTIRAGIREKMNQPPATLSAKPAQTELKMVESEESGGIDEENYEITEAFLKDMGL